MKSLCHILLCIFTIAAQVAATGTSTPERHLKAARLRSSVSARSNEALLRREFDLHYVDDQEWRPDAMGARLQLHGHSPTLLLEEIEHMLDEVYCDPRAKMAIRFRPEHYRYARDILAATPSILVVTSHAGCNQAGARMPYRAMKPVLLDGKHTAEFALGDASWQDDFGMQVRFGPASRGDYDLNRHTHLVPREAALDLSVPVSSVTPTSTPSTSSSAAATTQGGLLDQVHSFVAAIPTAVNFSSLPFPSSASNITNTSTVDDIAFSLQNTTILPPSFDNITIGIPLRNTGVKVSCIDCSTTGTVSLISGSFSTGSNGTGSFFKNGSVELIANGVGANVELDVTWLPAVAESVTIALAKIPLTPFAIPGIATVGATLIPNLIFSASVPSVVDFQFGFNISVPNNSTAVANFGSANRSTITGFPHSTVAAHPFQSQLQNVSLTLSATLQPEVLLGVTLLNQNTGAAVFLNLPQLSVNIAQVDGTNERCEPSPASAPAPNAADANATAPVPTDAARLFGNLTHFSPAVALAVGFNIQAGDLGQTAYTPFATTFALETACLAFDPQHSTFAPATIALASATATAASGPPTVLPTIVAANAAAALRLSPLAHDAWMALTRWQGAAVALALASGAFSVL